MNDNDAIFAQFERILDELGSLDSSSDEYKVLVDRLADLIKTQDALDKLNNEKAERTLIWKILNNGPLISALGTVTLGILVLWHERAAIVTSKAFGFLRFK